jgi:hypothetical protein
MRSAWPFLIVPLLAACGSKTGTDEGSGTETTTSATEDTVTPSTASSDETGAAACSEYASTPDIGPAVAITVRHEGTTPVFFAPNGCGGALTFAIFDAAGDLVPYLLDAECFPNTCEGFVDAADCSVGCNDCAPPSAGRIDAGAEGAGQWPGRRLAPLELSEACAPADGCPATCVRPDQAPSGSYRVELTVWRTCTGTCECDAPSSGVCGLWTGDEQLDDPVTFTAMIDYPAQTSVELVITD